MEKTTESKSTNGTALPSADVETSPVKTSTATSAKAADKLIVIEAQRAASLHRDALRGKVSDEQLDRIVVKAASKAIFAALAKGR